MRAQWFLLSMSLMSFVSSASSAQQLATLDDLIHGAQDRANQAEMKTLRRDVGIRDPHKQVESPEATTNSTSLLDTSSAADLFAMALSLSGLTATSEGDGGNDTTSGSATATAYALWSALQGVDPLDPDYYCQRDAIRTRRLSLSGGLENGADGTEDAVLVGAKFRLPIGYELCTSPAFESDGSIMKAKIDLGQEFGRVRGEVIRRVKSDPITERAVKAGKLKPNKQGEISNAALADFIDTDPEANALAASATEGLLGELRKRSAALDVAIASEIARATEGNQFALQVLTKQRENGGPDRVDVKGIWDYKGLLQNLDMSVNAGWERADGETSSDDDQQGGTLALSFQYQPLDRTLQGRRPLRLSLGGQAKWMSNTKDTYVGQLRIVVPLLEGVELPISVTLANRTELIDESEVRGTIGFTVDTTNILASLQR